MPATVAASSRRILQLGVGRARDHLADVFEFGIDTCAARIFGQRQLDRSLPLQISRQRAVIDQRIANAVEPADRAQRISSHQHAAASRCRRRCLAPVHPRKRIKHLEEENECRNERALDPFLAMKLHHPRRKHELLRLSPRNEPRERVRLIDNVGVRKQKIDRIARSGLRDALLHRPEFSGPACRRRAAGNDRQPVDGLRTSRRRGARFPQCRRCSGRRPARWKTLRRSSAAAAIRSCRQLLPPHRAPE